MNFLGSLGIDIKLLLAQLVNFVILLIILKKFLASPILKRIESDEKKLKDSEEKLNELDKEKALVAKEKESQIRSAKERSEELIREAETIATQIKSDARDKAEEEAVKILSQAKNRSLTEYANLEKETHSKLIHGLKGDFIKRLSGVFSRDNRNWGADEIYLQTFLKAIKRNLKSSGYKGEELLVEYAHTPRKSAEKRISLVIGKADENKTKIKRKINKNLILGYRLTSDNIIIEQNLLYEIKNI